TTLEPGARVVFTHGFDLRPFFAAFRARSPAASMTDGFEVLVHDVIAAMVTAPWSIVKFSPPERDTELGLDAVEGAWLACEWWWVLCSLSGVLPGGSEAGNDSDVSRSTRSWSTDA